MTSGTPEAPPLEAGEITMFELVTPLVRRWRLIALTGLACAVIAVVAVLLMRPVFTGRATFTPESQGGSGMSGSLAGLAGLAGQLGISGGGSNVSPDFFAKVVHSREILDATLRTPFAVPGAAAGVQRPLIDILAVQGKSPPERMTNGIDLLQRRVDATVDKPTSIITLEVEMPSPELAAAVTNRLVALLNQFNLEQRQTQSRAQRQFSGERLQVAERELREAEQQQESFISRNRAYSESPLLSFEAQRLERQVRVRNDVYNTLRKAYEEARIAEVRDTPVLTVIDSAVAPVRRTRPRRTLTVLMALVGGLLLGSVAAFMAEFRGRARPERSPELAALSDAWSQARHEAGAMFGRRPAG